MPTDEMRDATMGEGLVIRALSGFFTVRTADGRDVVCKLRGRLKQTRHETDIVTIGDRVVFQLAEDGSGVIESVQPRVRALVRRARVVGRRKFAARGMGHLEQDRGVVIVANPDLAVFVFACANPTPSLRMLDRFLVVAEANQIPVLICANKVDLVGIDAAKALFGLYEDIGYSVVYTSAHTGDGKLVLQGHLAGKLAVLTGPSGVGKSSLLNQIDPALGQAVGDISVATGKGRHTTVHPELFPLPGGGWLADTPGIRSLAMYDLTPEELDGYFVEIAPLVSQCEFRDCAHQYEPGCAVRAALEQGKLHFSRYDSYIRLRNGIYD